MPTSPVSKGRSRCKRWAPLVILAALLAAGCQGEVGAPSGVPSLREKEGSCPPGTQAVSSPLPNRCTIPEDSGARPPTLSEDETCSVQRTPPLRATNFLRSGFNVSPMRIAINSTTSPPNVEWVAPHDARFVTCALFSAPPVIDNETIVNKEAILSIEVLPPQGTFSLATRALNCDLAPEQSGCPGSLVDRLLVGCWAYSRTELIHASELLELEPGDIQDQNQLIFSECAETQRGGACYLANTKEYGVCFDGCCRGRCTVPSDCGTVLDETILEGSGGTEMRPVAMCTHNCQLFDGAVGACLPLDARELAACE